MKRKHFILALAAMLLSFAPPIFAQNVAKVGDTEYPTFSAAVNAALAGETVKLIANATESDPVALTKNLTIDGADHTFTGTMTGKAGLTVTVQNVNFVNGGFAKTTKSSTGVYTFKDCTFEDNGTIAYPLQIRGAHTLNVENCTAKNYRNSFLRLYSGAVNVSIKNVTVENCPSYAINFASGVTNGATIEGLTVKNSSNGLLIDNTSVRNLTIKDCTMQNVATAINHANGTSAITCTALGVNDFGTAVLSQYAKVVAAAQIGTKVYETLEAAAAVAQAGETVVLLQGTDAAVTLPAGVLLNKNGFDADNVVVTKPAVAKIGEQGYETFAAAVAAATAGQTITLLADVAESVTIGKSLTIVGDGDGKTITGTLTANAKGIYVTIKNIDFDGNNKALFYAVRADKTNSVTIDNCTAKNYNYGFLYANSTNNIFTIKDVTVENCANYGAYLVSYNNATFENFTVKGANNGILVDNTAARKLTLKGCKMEGVATAINHAKGTSAITVNVKGDVEFGAAGISQHVKFGGASAVLNGKYYASFDDAYAAAVKGDVITLLETAVISKNFTNYTKQITVKANFGATAFRVQGDAMMVTFGGMTIESDDYCIIVGSKDGSTGANVDINGGTYKGSCTAISITKGDVRINGGTFSVEPYEGSYDYTINCIDAAYKNKDARISIKGGKFYNFDPANNAAEGAGTNFVTGGYTTAKDAEGWYTTAAAVAEVAGVKYISLADAVAAAEDGATVTLIPTVSYVNGAGVVINKNITIDFNGKKYTVNKAVGSAGTETLGFQILKGNNVTLKNGTLTSTAVVAGKEVKMLIQNYANLTLQDMNIVDATDHILYALSNNCGETLLTGNTNITTDAVAFDSYKDNAYTAPTVTVETTGKIEGKIEKNDGATIAIKSGIFTVAIDPAWCAEGYLPVANADGTYGVKEDPTIGKVAKVGEEYYKTVDAAITAAPAGATITLIANVNENVTISKNLTIDGAGKQYTGTMTANKDLTVTVENVNFVNGGIDKPKAQKSTTGTYTIKNCTFVDEGKYAYSLRFYGAKTLNVENCTVKNYLYSFLYINGSTLNLNINNVTVEDCPNYAVYFATGVNNATIEGLTVKNSNNGIVVNNTAARTLTIKNCKMENVTTAINDAGNGTGAINCTALGLNDFGTAALSQYAVIKAQAQSGSLYGDLASVVEAAEADATVTLLADATGAGAVIDKNLTIDFGDKTYTFNQTVGSTGTTTLGLQILKDNNVILKNGTLTSTAAVMGSKEVKVLIQNYANLTLEDMNLIDNTEHIQYALSNNSGNTVIKGITNITTDAVAFDVYDYTSGGYAVPTVTVETTGTIDGKIEVSESINDNLQIKSGIYTMDVNKWCAPGFICKANEDGKYGIEKANFKLKDTYYATLAEAIAAIGAGDNVIELLASATLDYNAREAYGTAETASVTINGNGHTLTLNQKNSDWSSFGLAAGKVAFKNMTIEKTGYGDTSGAWNTHAIIFSSPVEMTGVTINNGIAVQAGAILNNVTINEANGYYGLWINGNGQAVTVNGGAINATNGGRGIKIADQYIDAPAQVSLTVDGTVFTTAKKAAVLVSSKAGAKITASNVNIENVAADKVNFVWVDEDWAQHFANVQVEGATVAQEGIEGFVAQLPNGASYKTLAAAITAATAGETITLIANTEEDVTVSKNLIIEGAGKQYTGIMTLNKVNATIQNLNFVKGQISKSKNYSGGNVTIVNCNFDGQGMNSYAVNVARTGSVVIENVTAQNYGYGFLQLSHANNELSIKDVKVTNTNYALKIDYSNGVTIDGLKVEDVKIAAIYNSNYGTKTYTITNSDFSGAVEAIKMWERNTTVYNTFVFAGGNTLGDATLSTSPYAIYKGVVAEVGTKKYLDLRVAFDEAQDGETVTLIADVVMDTKALTTNGDDYAAIVNVAGKAVTLDLNGKNITVDAAATDLASAKGGMLLAVFSADLGGHLTLTDNSDAKNGAVILNVNDANVYSMFASESKEKDKSNSGKITVNGGKYTTVGKVANAMFFADANRVITINGGTFICDGASTTSAYPWMVNTLGNNELSVLVNGGTFNVAVNRQYRPYEVHVPAEKAVVANGDGTWTVATAVAAIEGVGYTSLAEAVEAAEAGETVELLDNATGAGVVINKSITIDFGGKIYSLNEGVGSTGTASNGFQILKGNEVTLMNGTLNVAAEAADKFYILVQNYANLTVADMNLNGTNLDKWSTTDGDSYVLSNNSGEVVITGNTNIIANDEGSKAFAFDACDKTAWGYKLPVVYVQKTEDTDIITINGKIERTGNATIAISSGTFTAEILPEWCAEYYAPVQNADGTWTVDYRYEETKTIVDDDYTPFENLVEKTIGKLTYKRKIPTADVWQSIYVPFEIPVEKLTELGYDVAYYLDVHFEVVNGEINMEKAPEVHLILINEGTLKANFPYAIRAKSSKIKDLNLELVLENAKLYSTAAENMNSVESGSTVNRFVFAGTYTRSIPSVLTGNDTTPCYAVTKKGEFKKMGVDAGLPPFRVYMSIIAKDGSPFISSGAPAESIRMRVIGEESEDETTGIKFYEFDNEQTSDYIYDLHGRRVMEPQKGSIYIVNGKKVVF